MNIITFFPEFSESLKIFVQKWKNMARNFRNSANNCPEVEKYGQKFQKF